MRTELNAGKSGAWELQFRVSQKLAPVFLAFLLVSPGEKGEENVLQPARGSPHFAVPVGLHRGKPLKYGKPTPLQNWIAPFYNYPCSSSVKFDFPCGLVFSRQACTQIGKSSEYFQTSKFRAAAARELLSMSQSLALRLNTDVHCSRHGSNYHLLGFSCNHIFLGQERAEWAHLLLVNKLCTEYALTSFLHGCSCELDYTCIYSSQDRP